MPNVVVRNVEELKSLRSNRQFPAILIDSEFSNNLLISGRISIASGSRGRVLELKNLNQSDPMSEVIEILNDLSRYNEFELKDGANGAQIKIYPKATSRREGN